MALSLAPPRLHDAFAVALALDERLARIVGSVTEPMLGQMRLAWWRDRLREPASSRPRGDVVLDAAAVWDGHDDGLVALVDGWEAVLVEGEPAAQARGLGEARNSAFGHLARIAGEERAVALAGHHGMAWGFATIAHAAQDKAAVLSAWDETTTRLPTLPRVLRPLALIGRLSDRALRRGGAPILGDRLSPLAAARIGLLGR